MIVSLTSINSQMLALLVALCASACIGIERQLRHKDAGLRTHSLVGLGAALFAIISKYGYADLAGAPGVQVDPSRVTAQVVAGIGFIGAGVVFTRSAKVKGLTTAASVWLTAAVGSAAGSGLLILAIFCTALYFVVVLVFPLLEKLIRGSHPTHWRDENE